MTNREKILADLVARLRASAGAAVDFQILAHNEDGLLIQVGLQKDAVVGVQVHDEQRPSFSISYPKLSIKRNGKKHVSVAHFETALTERVISVVKQLDRGGIVKPEFSG